MKFLSTFLRSFAIQASWTFSRLQATGWCVTIEPLLRLLPGGKHGSSYRDAMTRAGQYFNSHPFLANFAIGAVARAELKGVEPEQVTKFRDAIKGPLGSVGDRLIWAGVLPVASAVGLLLVVLVSPIIGVIAFLVSFNVVHVTVRIWGLREGWTKGLRVTTTLQGRALQTSIKVGDFAAPFALGLATPLLTEHFLTGFDGATRVAALVAAAASVVILRWLTPTVSAARLGTAAIVVALVIGWLWP